MNTTPASDHPARLASRVLACAVMGSLVLLASACGSSSPKVSTGATTTTAAASSSTTAGTVATTGGSTATTFAGSATTTTAASQPTTTAATGGGHACTTKHTSMPAGSVTKTSLDVDGDGRPDTIWLSPGSHRMVGITTAAGGTSAVEVMSASPIPLSAFVVDAQSGRPYQILVSDGRQAYLYVFADCVVEPVHNKQGQLYTFDLGFGDYGTGVGCSVVGGKLHLVGLDAKSETGTTVTWTRTVVNVVGTHATNGVTQSGVFHQPGDQHAIDLLHTLSCGNLTITADGAHAPE